VREVQGGEVRIAPVASSVVTLPDLFGDPGSLGSPAAMTFRQLRAHVLLLADSGHAVDRYLIPLYAKLAFPLTTVVLAVLGISCALRCPVHQRVAAVAVAVAIVLAHWFTNALALSLGRTELISPLVAVSAANVIGGAIGLYLFVRMPT
jgi:lipopolysaccharide export system permease protein